ncbi:galactose mutarotase [Sphingobacteriaceae bacterium WQ 2009]|uniref:Aldose 1-epimerase n=1 Tax=Rhinopithecimicrobium faecis TaxID=2820698 RepID=A0A8T4HBI3_9SPHI|nr:galactose mutarotase [Sphingobacteriaceae bacterium WQ 2009]
MKKLYIPIFSVACLLVCANLLSSCQQNGGAKNAEQAAETPNFETTIAGKEVKLFTLSNNNNAIISLTNYGARLVSLRVPNREGQPIDVILGYDQAQTFKDHAANFYGAVVGRFGNRIANGTFSLDSQVYQLEQNDGKHSLHGGTNGLYNQVWDALQKDNQSIVFSYLSKDGEAGYPGNVRISVEYRLTEENALKITYQATTDKNTVLNLTNHAYFNLNGEGDATILDHELQIYADKFTPVDESLIPTGALKSVQNTPFDFRKPTAIGKHIDQDDIQLARGKGYDHNWVLAKENGLDTAAIVYSPKTGIEMMILTEEPGLQFYSGNFMSADDPKGKSGHTYGYRAAFCLETQHFPDSPNQENFPTTLLKVGETYKSETSYLFSVK